MTDIDLGKFPLLAPLTESERAAVADEFEVIDAAPGETLFREGEPAGAALFVVSGCVRVFARRVGVGADVGPGEVLGTLSLVVDGPREASAETLSHSLVWRLSRSGFRRIVETEPVAACRLLEGILNEYAGAVRSDVASDERVVDPVSAND